jgi:hypothetical protein
MSFSNAARENDFLVNGAFDRLRILVGPDAHIIDRMREDPDHAYEPESYERFAVEASLVSRPLTMEPRIGMIGGRSAVLEHGHRLRPPERRLDVGVVACISRAACRQE